MSGAPSSIDWYSLIELGVLALLLGGIGALQLTRALTREGTVAQGRVVGSHHRGGLYNAEEWVVDVAVGNQGYQEAYSHALYDAVRHRDDLPVTVHLRGELVTEVDLAGHAYRTSAVSTNEAWIEAGILFALFALTLYGMVRVLRRSRAAPG